MDRYKIYAIDLKGSVIKQRITDKTFSTYQEAKDYAMKLAENIAVRRNEKVEMLDYVPNFDKSGYGEVLIAKMDSYFILVQR